MEMSTNMAICWSCLTGPRLAWPRVFPKPRHTTSALPRLITHRPALIFYGRPCDPSHSLVHLTASLQGSCLSPVRLVFCFGLAGPHPGLHIAVWCHQAPPIDCLATIRKQDLQVPSNLEAIHCVIGYYGLHLVLSFLWRMPRWRHIAYFT